jgi:hypothetical protein
MAEKVIAIKMTLDAGQTVSEIENVEQGLKGVDEQIDNINNDSKKLSQAEKSFADLNKRVESGEMTIKQMAKAVKEYQTIAIQAGKDSPIGQQAILKAAELKDELGDLNTQVSNLGHDGKNMQSALQLGSTVIGGYSAFQGVTAMLGVENEKLAETFVKLQGAQSALAGIEQIRANLEKESFLMLKAKDIQTKVLTASTTAYNIVVGTSTGALKAFRIALAMTGIGALIIGLGLLIANFEKVTEFVGKAATALMAWFGFIDVEQQKAISATKKQTAELRKQTQQRVDDLKDQMKSEEVAENARQKTFDLEIARLDAEGKSSKALKEQKLNDALEFAKKQLELNEALIQSYVDYYKNQAMLQGMSEQDFIDSMKRQGVDLVALQEKANASLQGLRDDIYSAETDLIAFKNESKKGVEVNIKFPDPEELEKAFTDSTEALNYIDVEDFAIESEDLIPEEEVQVAIGRLEEFFIKLKAYRETGSEDIKAELAESIQATYDVANQALDTLTAINDFANQIGDNRVKKIEQQKKQELSVYGLTAKQKFDIEMKSAKAVDEIRKKQFNREKALNIAKATMDTGAAVVKALASAPPPANFILAGLVGVAGAAQIATIASQKFDGSASQLSAPDFGSAIGGQENGSGSGNTNTTLVNANQGGYTETEGLITKVVMVESDVTKIQKDIAKIDAISTIGG